MHPNTEEGYNLEHTWERSKSLQYFMQKRRQTKQITPTRIIQVTNHHLQICVVIILSDS